MKRTQIYLTEKQHKMLSQKARADNTTMSQTLRDLIQKQFTQQESQKELKKNAGSVLLAMSSDAQQKKVRGPKDLASNVDYYLYGKEK